VAVYRSPRNIRTERLCWCPQSGRAQPFAHMRTGLCLTGPPQEPIAFDTRRSSLCRFPKAPGFVGKSVFLDVNLFETTALQHGAASTSSFLFFAHLDEFRTSPVRRPSVTGLSNRPVDSRLLRSETGQHPPCRRCPNSDTRDGELGHSDWSAPFEQSAALNLWLKVPSPHWVCLPVPPSPRTHGELRPRRACPRSGAAGVSQHQYCADQRQQTDGGRPNA
jgi:hypothetical protein